AITSSAGATITVADNSDNLTLVSTDADANFGPNLNFYRNSSSPADDDLLAQIDFNGRNDNSQDVLYANIQTQIIDASDGTEDGRFQINTIVAGTDRNRFLLTPTETVFNDNSIDLDFRVESNGQANMLLVDGGDDVVKIGGITGSASGTLKVKSNSSHFALALEENSGSEAYQLGVVADGSLVFTNSGSTEVMRLSDGGLVGIGTSSPDGTLHVHTASAGTVSASSQADDLVVENNAETGITIISPDDESARIRFTSPSTNTDVGGATIFYRQNINKMLVGTAVSGGTLALASGAGNETMTLDSSGNVGIGASTVDTKLHLEESGATSLFIKTENSAGALLVGCNSSGNSFVSAQTTGKPLILETQNTERMRLTDTGDLLFAQTSGSAADVGHIMQQNGVMFHTASERAVMFLRRNNTDGTILQFRKNGTSVGTISTNANSLPSDRNFKNNISYDFALGLDFVTSLKPVTYNYKIDDAGAPVMSGLIAQDVEESLSAAGVEKNSMTLLQHVPTDDEEQSDYEMDYLKLVPVLIKSIQEQQKIITALETRIKTLENN
ncbi:MAG TPA: hypothetical protein DCL39_17985, partial [Alteromonas macleodii]|nr:hypothetical protein [Alteromonas macleodii]